MPNKATTARSLDRVGPTSGRAQILVVDDDERNILALTEVLQDIGDIVPAASGKNALRHLLTQEVAVILLDVHMPEMDGYEVAQLIRKRKQTARIPIIFLSAVNKEVEHLMRGYAMGAVDYVFKPVDPIVLKSKVSVFVDLYNMHREVEARARREEEIKQERLQAELERLQVKRELDEILVRQAAIIHSLPIILYREYEGSEPRLPSFVGGNFEAVTGFRFDEVVASPDIWLNHIHPDDRERTLAALAERKQTGSMAVEYRWQCADGQYKYFLDQSVLLPGDCSEMEYAGTLIDISERKGLEAQLLQAGKLDALGQLTGGIAHDFNNLLAAMLGGIRLLEGRLQLDEREQTIFQHMRNAAERGVELVRGLMTFARKQELHPVSIAPEALRQSVSGLVEHTLGGAIDIEWHLDCGGISVHADKAQLELAMVNLIINARDAMADGGTIKISMTEVTPPENAADQASFLSIAVEDSGHGIAKEIVNRITEPFFTTKQVGAGTGLGLSMVAGFVQQSGGKIDIRSIVGQGTTIEIQLPGVMTAPTASAAGVVRDPGAGIRRAILLVDDDHAVRDIVSEQLLELQHEVIAVSNGEQALEFLRQPGCQIDILLADFAMPGLNGIQTILQAKQIRPALRAVLMTGHLDTKWSLDDQDVLIFTKPLNNEDLLRVLLN